LDVTDPEGVRWQVSRRWLELPWRWWRPDFAPDFLMIDESIVGTLLIIVLALLLVFVGIPLLVFLAAVLIAVLGLAFRIAFGRPWVVEAKSERGELQWRVRGARGSRRAMHEIAAALRRGGRDFSPAGAERLLPDSPFLSPRERNGNVRVLGRRR
jgi:hypothetical protein